MNVALAEGWIAEERIADRHNIARARVERRKAQEAIKRIEATGAASIPNEDPTNEEIEHEAAEMKVIEGICQAAVSLRNGLAHGERYLQPGSPQRLQITADLINQLYS